MDLATHGVIGLALGSLAGGPALLQNPMALGSLIGSVLPDGDVIFQAKGDYCYLKNHRSASHSIPMAAGLSFVVSIILTYIFQDYSIWLIFAWTFLGYLVHTGLDLFNSYGASILWPFKKKKYKSALLMLFDPIVFLAAIMVYFNNITRIEMTIASIVCLLCYIVFRGLMRRRVKRNLEHYFELNNGDKIVILPSASRFFKWDFIVYNRGCIVTGQVHLLKKNPVIRDRLIRSESWVENMVMNTPLGKFFKEFSPHYHINWVRDGENHYAILADLRYYIRGDYLHHGTILFNGHFEPIRYIFQPYHPGRKIKMPV